MKKILSLYIVLISLAIQAQQVQDTVKTEVINVTRSFEPKVQDAYKLDVSPEIDKLPEQKIPVDFHIQSVPVASTFTPEKGGMATFNAGNMAEDVYKSYASLAGGNYTQIKGDAYVYYPVNDKLGSAFRFSHYSSQGQHVDDGISYDPFYHTSADLLFDYKNPNSRWNFDLGYNGHINYLKQAASVIMTILPVEYNTFQNKHNNFVLTAQGEFDDLIIDDINFSYNNFWDGFDNSENKIHVLGNLKFPVGGIDLKLGLQTDWVGGDLGRVGFVKEYSGLVVSYKNMDFGVLPAIQIENEKLVLNAGAKIFYQNQDTLYNSIQFIPDAKASLNLIEEKLTVFAGVTGDLQQNSQMALSAKNPYLSSDTPVLPTLIPYDIFGGFNGAFSSAFSYEVSLGFRKIKNYPFYNYNGFYVEKYNLLYDDMAQSYFDTAFNIGIGRKFDMKLHLTYLQNDPEHLRKALFIPDFSFKSILIFRPTDKLNFNATVHSLGDMYYASRINRHIGDYTDLNLGVRYNINKQFTGFLQADNVLGKAYQMYYRYPVQKFQIMAGATYRFDMF